MQYQIGDFSKISRLSIKALRFYHECGLLIPTRIEKDSGYRYYDETCLEKAALIHEFKDLDFTLNEIKQILDNMSGEADITSVMEQKYREITQKIKKYKAIQAKLSNYMKQMEAVNMDNENEIVLKDVTDILIASIRYHGRYDEMGSIIKSLYKTCGRFITGTCFALYYDEGFKEEDADIEVCLPVSREINSGSIKSRILKGGKAASLIYRGPYGHIGQAYKTLFDHIQKNKLDTLIPSREIYQKGPGMMLKGNPDNYVTEIQMLLK